MICFAEQILSLVSSSTTCLSVTLFRSVATSCLPCVCAGKLQCGLDNAEGIVSVTIMSSKG